MLRCDVVNVTVHNSLEARLVSEADARFFLELLKESSPEDGLRRERLIDTFTSRLAIAGRNAGPEMLWSWWGAGMLGSTELNALIALVWSLAEFPEESIGRRAWLPMFRKAGFVTDVGGVERPGSALQVFRGTTWGRRRRMAWTSDVGKALWFARRTSLFGLSGVLVGAVAPPDGILGIFHDRSESEVVVDPASLTSVKRIEAVPWTEG